MGDYWWRTMEQLTIKKMSESIGSFAELHHVDWWELLEDDEWFYQVTDHVPH